MSEPIKTSESGDKAWALHNGIVENEMKRRGLLLDSMKLIHELHNSGLYRAVLGDEDAPWSAYLSQHEVFYSASKVYTMDKVYQKFVKELEVSTDKISDIPVTKLSQLLKIVTKENVDEWIIKARELTTHDFEDEVRVAMGKESYLTCPHNFANYEICAKCGFRHRK
jgi:hypothetical protein